MKLVRIVSETPSDAADLIFFLESHGFVIQTGPVSDPSQPLADFEIDLRVLRVDDALQLAREMASGEVDVLIGPGVLSEAGPLVEARPFLAAQLEPETVAQPKPFVEVPPFLEPELLMEAKPETFAEPFVEAQAVAEVQPVAKPEPFAQAEPFIEPHPELAPASSQAEYEMADESLAVEAFKVDEVTASAEDKPPQPAVELDPVTASRRLRESIAQVLTEAGLTARECVALCSAELLNGSEHARQWLSQARVLIVRKRALVETRALRARAIVENRLRFDSTSQNAWIRSAFAGAGLMIVLLAVMIWKDQRFAFPNHGSFSGGSAATELKSAPSSAPSAETGPSARVTAGLHRRLSSDRADLVDDREVVIRHFGRPTPKRAAVMNTKSGIKHISDMN